MNTNAYYQHQQAPPDPQPATTPATETDLAWLARRGDPSLPHPAAASLQPGGGRSIAWVRPTELATTVTSPLLTRGADLQTEMARRVRRAPASAARAGGRVTRSAIARPAPASPTPEELGL